MSDAGRFHHVAIRASAGTGKTFQLTNRYIGLVAAGESPDRILATTSTRKAAAEIRDRVLKRLASAADSEAEASELAGHIERPELTTSDFAAMLVRLVRQMHRLNIGTLDSVFMRIARSFEWELGLPANWRITDDIDAITLRRDAIDAMMDGDPQHIVDLIRLLDQGNTVSRVSEEIDKIVVSLHGLFCEAPALELWNWLEGRAELDREALAQAYDRLRDVELAGKQITGARLNTLFHVAVRDWKSFLGSGLGKAEAGGGRFGRSVMPDALREALRPLVTHAQAAVVNALANQTRATYQLLADYHAQYERLQQRSAAVSYGDVTRALLRAGWSGGLDEIYYRLDQRVGHLLLDEFQDTSLDQWHVIEPIAAEVASHATGERSLFCVGDLKQAIYGWRGGEARIFDRLDSALHLEWESLNQSYRSSRVVIDTVNRVFDGIADRVSDRYRAATEQWVERFDAHSTAKGDMAGYAELRVAERGGRDDKLAMLRCAAELAAELHDAHESVTVGVLVRRNEAVGRTIELLRERGVFASEEGGNPLTDSPAVNVVLSLLRLADHPGDRIARYHVASSPLGGLLGYTDREDDAAARRLARAVRRDLLHDGYGRVVFGWVRMLAPVCDRRNVRRLTQLAELAAAYDERASLRTDDFVQTIQERRVEDPTGGRVRVMTVHQAKGLEFDAVVLAELDVQYYPRPGQALTSRLQPLGPIERVSRFAGEAVRSQDERLEQMHQQFVARGMADSLSTLYVALTRAARALYMVISPPQMLHNKLMYSSLIRQGLGIEETTLEPGVAWSSGDERWHESLDVKPAAVAGQAEVDLVLAGVSDWRSRSLQHVSPSQLEGGATVSADHLLRLDRGGETARLRGTVIHGWCEQIEWLDAGEPDRDALVTVAQQKGWADGVDALLNEFDGMLGRESVRAVLSRSSFADGAQVYREAPFVVRDGDRVIEGIIDRLVVERVDGEVGRAVVIDFKTDRCDAENAERIEELTAYYRPQIEAYGGAVAKRYGLSRDDVEGRLVFLDAGLVRCV